MNEKEETSPARPVGAVDLGAYWNPSREELFVWLRSNALSLAELYKGSVSLLFDARVPGYTRFVSHAVREIRNRLPGALTGIESAGRVEYKGRLDDISAEWKKSGIVLEAQTSEAGAVASADRGSGEIGLPRKLARNIGRLIEEHDAAREKPRDTAVRLFEGAAPRNQQFREALRPVVLQWMEVCNWFMERTHDSGTADEGIDLIEFRKNFELFESTLLGIVRGVSTFFVNTDELDVILKQGPTPANVEAAIARMGYGEYNRYFFELLEDPEWIRPLKAKGFFTGPPPPIKDETEGTVAFPSWPESRFLVRMSKISPEIVAEIVLEVPTTDNIRVHDDLADVALALPPSLAAKIVPEAKTWVGARHKVLLDEKLGALVVKLVAGGESKAALELAGKLLEVLPDPKPILVPEPIGHFDGWHYERLLNKSIPSLVESLGVPAFVLACDLLDSAVRLGQKEAEAGEDFQDYSFVWRPAIEHGRGFSRGVTDALVSAVLNGAMQMVSVGKASLEEMVTTLEKRRWPVFRRIALYILREFAEHGNELVSQRLSDPARFDQAGVSREYWLLAGSEFAKLAEAEKEKVLEWIDRGPDLDTYKTRIAEFTGEVVSEEQAAGYGKRWRRDHFAVVKDGLSGKWKTTYEELTAELGSAEDVTAVRSVTGGAFSPPSPKNETDLSEMAIQEVVAFLKSWEPSREPMGERKAGLASKLGMAVAADPSKFTAHAQEFKSVDPTYLREFFQALLIPAGQGRGVDWKEVLALGQWIVAQPRTIAGRKGGPFDQDPDWGWTRSAIARLLSAGFQADTLPMDLRSVAWEILEKLAADEDPTVGDEDKYLSEKNADPASLSINSVRGEALHGVVQYAHWVRRDFEKRGAKDLMSRGFDEMSEVRALLERHLDPTVDATLATRSVYGRWLPWLQFLDGQWFEQHLTNIFPTGEKETPLRDCAWTTYVVLCEPYDAVFAAIRSEYQRAVEKIGAFQVGKSHLGDPDGRLASHLMALYWRGKLELPSEKGLLQDFFASAPDRLRGEAIGFVGRTLKNDTGEIAVEVLNRLQSLWSSRLEAANSAPDRSAFRLELSQFGWWFVSGRFSDDWSLDQLLATLRITGKVEADLWVVERLRELSSTMCGKAIECLSLMVDGDEEGWGMLGWRDEARKILEVGMASAESETRKAARALIHKLGGLGYFEFGRLLAADQS